jgi:hypothetical protein
MNHADSLARCPRCGHDHYYNMYVSLMNEGRIVAAQQSTAPYISVHRRCESCTGTWEVQLELGTGAKVIVV